MKIVLIHDLYLYEKFRTFMDTYYIPPYIILAHLHSAIYMRMS